MLSWYQPMKKPPLPVSNKQKAIVGNIDQKIHLSVNELIGSIEALSASPYKGSANLSELSKIFHINNMGEILHIVGALQILNFANVTSESIKLNKHGKLFFTSSLEDRKKCLLSIYLTIFLLHPTFVKFYINV